MSLHRRSPFTSAVTELRQRGSVALMPGRPDEHAQVRALVDRIYGPASAGLAAAWLAEQP